MTERNPARGQDQSVRVVKDPVGMEAFWLGKPDIARVLISDPVEATCDK